MDPALLIILIFIVAPLLEKLLKAGRQDQEPPRQRPGPRPAPRPRIELPPERRPAEVQQREDDVAADMLPDDLWEILTGERRVPQGVPEPEPEYEFEYEEEDVASYDEEAAIEPLPVEPPPRPVPQEPVHVEPYERPIPVRDAPRVVSMEKLSYDPERRHGQFHDRLEQLAAERQPRMRQRPRPLDLTQDLDLRRAIIMAEVLGKPKGLE